MVDKRKIEIEIKRLEKQFMNLEKMKNDQIMAIKKNSLSVKEKKENNKQKMENKGNLTNDEKTEEIKSKLKEG